MRIKQFCESGLSCVVETNKHKKIRTIYYSKLISTSSNLFEKRNLENCFKFNNYEIPFEKICLQIYAEIQPIVFNFQVHLWTLWHDK